MQILPPESMTVYPDAARQRDLLPRFYLELGGALRLDELDTENRTISIRR